MTATATYEIAVEIGGLPIVVNTDSSEFADLLRDRYGSFVSDSPERAFELDIELIPSVTIYDDCELTVHVERGKWIFDRRRLPRRMRPRQPPADGSAKAANPYSIDGVLRILHSLLLAPQSGFLVHASSAVRNGRAFIFSGVSGAGKTTMARLAPPDAIVLTDEISYIRRTPSGYLACGTPFRRRTRAHRRQPHGFR